MHNIEPHNRLSWAICGLSPFDFYTWEGSCLRCTVGCTIHTCLIYLFIYLLWTYMPHLNKPNRYHRLKVRFINQIYCTSFQSLPTKKKKKNRLLHWFDDKKLLLKTDVIGWNSLKKKRLYDFISVYPKNYNENNQIARNYSQSIIQVSSFFIYIVISKTFFFKRK